MYRVETNEILRETVSKVYFQFMEYSSHSENQKLNDLNKTDNNKKILIIMDNNK